MDRFKQTIIITLLLCSILWRGAGGEALAQNYQDLKPWTATASVANTYTATITNVTLLAGRTIKLSFATANTGASTLALNGGAAKNIYKQGSTPISSGDIKVGQVTELSYDGTQWQLLGVGESIESGSVDLTIDVTGILPVANGGTNLSTLGSGLQVLRVNAGATALEYATLTTSPYISSLTAAAATNTINNAAYAQEWQWNSATTETGLKLSSTSVTSGKVFNVSTNSTVISNTAGTNALAYFESTGNHGATTAIALSGKVTGTGTLNIGLYGAASGGTTNYAIRTDGEVYIKGSGTGIGEAFRIDDSGSNNKFLMLDNGTANFTPNVSTGTGATAGIQIVGNFLTTGNLMDVSSPSATTGFLAKYTSTSTTINHTQGTHALVGVASSGANGTSNKSTVGVQSIVSNTGTTSTNIAAYFAASGATNNYAGYFNGTVIMSNTYGYTPFSTYESLFIRKDGNAGNVLALVNATSGASASTSIVFANNGSYATTGNIVSTATGYTPSGIVEADALIVYSTKPGGINVGTIGNYQTSLWTANTKRFVIDFNGNFTHTQSGQTTASTFQTFTQAVYNTPGAIPLGLLWTGGAHTGIATGTEITDWNINLSATTSISGSTTNALNRTVRIQPRTYTAASATTWNDAATVDIGGAPTGGGAGPLTITRPWALRIAAGASSFGGSVYIGAVNVAPTAYLQINAGTATASTGPFKLTTSGTGITGLLTTAEKGSVEFSDYGLWFSPAASTRDKVLHGLMGATAPGTSAIGVILDYYGTSATRVLTTPTTWISVKMDDGTVYKIPAY